MFYSFEIKAVHGIDIYPGDYLKMSLFKELTTKPLSIGLDEYHLQGLLLPGKRIAGLGRRRSYTLSDLPLGLSIIEADPPNPVFQNIKSLKNLRLRLWTNLFRKEVLLKYNLSLRVSGENQSEIEIPLDSPLIKLNCLSESNEGICVQLSGNLVPCIGNKRSFKYPLVSNTILICLFDNYEGSNKLSN